MAAFYSKDMKPIGWIGLLILLASAVALVMPQAVPAPSWLEILLMIVGMGMVFYGRK